MSKPFDATLKHLLENYPRDWLRLIGVSGSAPVMVIDADLSTVTAAADKVLRVGERPPWLLHLELQASYDMGLEYEKAFTQRLLKGVRSMKESVTYQAILDEGRAEGRVDEARRILLALGTKSFGKPSARVRRTIAAITDPAVFELLAARLFDVASWDELLADS